MYKYICISFSSRLSSQCSSKSEVLEIEGERKEEVTADGTANPSSIFSSASAYVNYKGVTSFSSRLHTDTVSLYSRKQRVSGSKKNAIVYVLWSIIEGVVSGNILLNWNWLRTSNRKQPAHRNAHIHKHTVSSENSMNKLILLKAAGKSIFLEFGYNTKWKNWTKSF